MGTLDGELCGWVCMYMVYRDTEIEPDRWKGRGGEGHGIILWCVVSVLVLCLQLLCLQLL